jgi:hypothetical protein
LQEAAQLNVRQILQQLQVMTEVAVQELVAMVYNQGAAAVGKIAVCYTTRGEGFVS